MNGSIFPLAAVLYVAWGWLPIMEASRQKQTGAYRAQRSAVKCSRRANQGGI